MWLHYHQSADVKPKVYDDDDDDDDNYDVGAFVMIFYVGIQKTGAIPKLGLMGKYAATVAGMNDYSIHKKLNYFNVS